MYVTVITVRGIVAEVRRRGLPIEGLLEYAGISERLLQDTRASIPIAHFERLVLQAMGMTSCPSLGLSAGTALPEFQLMSHFAQALPTLRAAIEMLERYAPIFVEGMQMWLHEEGELATLEYGFNVGPNPVVERLCTELWATLCSQMAARYFTDSKGPREVRFVHGEPPYAAQYRSTFGCPVRFSSESCAIVFDANLLDRVQPLADSFMVDLLREACDNMLTSATRALTHSDRVRQHLAERTALAHVDPLHVAQELGLTPRMLRRSLSREGTSLTNLIEQTRMKAAADQLRDPSATIKQVAAHLGYSDATSFHRAFKRWNGITPGEYIQRSERYH